MTRVKIDFYLKFYVKNKFFNVNIGKITIMRKIIMENICIAVSIRIKLLCIKK